MQVVVASRAMVEQVHERLVAAIVEGRLAAGSRLRQEELANTLAVSRQPVSHALQLLKQQGLAIEAGRRGLIVVPIDATRIRQVYQVRASLDALAARLAAGRDDVAARGELATALASGLALTASEPIEAFVRADAAFHAAVYRLSGNPMIEMAIGGQWPLMMRSMGVSLGYPELRTIVWVEHETIAAAVMRGDAAAAEAAACRHAERAGEATAQRLEQGG